MNAMGAFCAEDGASNGQGTSRDSALAGAPVMEILEARTLLTGEIPIGASIVLGEVGPCTSGGGLPSLLSRQEQAQSEVLDAGDSHWINDKEKRLLRVKNEFVVGFRDSVAAGDYTLAFWGLSVGDKTAFLDEVELIVC